MCSSDLQYQWLHTKGRVIQRDVNGVPLLLFHFTMVQHSQGNFRPFVTRPLLEAQPVLRDLLLDYGRQLDAAGHGEFSRLPFGLGNFANGLPISKASRRAFRTEFMRGKTADDPYSDPAWIAYENDQAARLVVQTRFNGWLRRPRAWKDAAAERLQKLAVGYVKRRRAAKGRNPTP